MFAGMLFGIVLTMRLFPDIPISRSMHRAFVEDPLAVAGRMTRAHLIFAILAFAALFAFSELIMLLGSSDLVMLMAWDMSLYVDAVIAAWTIAAVARAKGFVRYLATKVPGVIRMERPRASRRRTIARLKANDSESDGPCWGYALAA